MHFVPLHNNAPSHNTTMLQQFLTKKKVLLFFTTPLPRQIWHLWTTFYSLKWNPTLRVAI
jgi:hypothetical protein